MKRKLFFLVVLALIINLTALIINMVSDEAEALCAKYLGEHYIAILTILFIILLLVSVFLADWENLFGKKENKNENQSTEKSTLSSPPTDVPEIIPEEKISLPEKTYYEIINKITENEFQKAFQLLQSVPAFENQAVRLLGRFDLFNQQKVEGRISIDQETNTLNTLRADMLSMIEPFKPLKDYKEEVEVKGFQKTTYGYKINGTDDRRLNCPQNFLGRDKALEDILKVLENPKTLAVQIKGEAGIGKTDFCKQAIRKYLKKQAQRNAFWVEVEFIGDTLALLSAIGQLLGLSEIAKKEQVFAAIENSQGLFVLDNLETLEKDKNIVRLLDELKNINNTLWISTTRTQLGTWNVFPIQQLKIEDATQLFIEQWRKSSGEELTKNQDGLKDFIQKDLGCHPLSIILTASRGADLFSLDEVTKAWKNGSKIITQRYAGKRGHRLDDSDHSLELSFGSLQDHPNAVRLWALCCFFPEGVSVQDLEYFAENKIASAEDRAVLLQRSILRKENGKLDMLPPFKRFALKKIKENKKSIEQQVFEDGMGFAMEYTPEGYIRKHPILLTRLPFIFQFLEYFASKVLQYPKLLDLADKMMNLFIFKPFLSKEILEKIIRADLKSDSFKNLKPQFQKNLGDLEFLIGNNDTARQLWASASGLYKKIGDDQGKANCQRSLGELEFRIGNNDIAQQLWASASGLYEKTGNDLGKANCQINLGELEFRIGNNDTARQLWASASGLYEKTGDDLGKANCQSNLGDLEFRIGKNDTARQLWASASILYEKIGSDLGKANCQKSLGELEFRIGKNDTARQLWESATILYEKTGSNQGKANCQLLLGRLFFQTTNSSKAKKMWASATNLFEQGGDNKGIAWCLIEYGKLEIQLGNKEKAKIFFNDALQLFEKINYSNGIKYVKEQLENL